MYDDFPSLFRYHRDSDARFVEAIRALPAGLYEEAEPFEVGWPTIRSVLVHLADAGDIWSRRLVGESPSRRRAEAELPAIDDAARLLEEAHDRFANEILPAMSPERLAGLWAYRDVQGKARTLPMWAALRHVVNHGSYHRGQIASKLKRRGVTPPVTDLAMWACDATPQDGV